MVGFKVGDILKRRANWGNVDARYEIVQVTGTDIYIKTIAYNGKYPDASSTPIRLEHEVAHEYLEHVTKLEKYLEWT